MINSPTFFYLDPQDHLAAQIVSLPENAPFNATREGKACLRIGVDHNPKNTGQLVSFGCDFTCCDILLPRGYSERQCHFFLHPLTGEVVLRDDTADFSTLLTDQDDPMELSRLLPTRQPRQRVVLGTKPDYLLNIRDSQFMLSWSDRTRAFDAAKSKSFVTRSIAPISNRHLVLESGTIIHLPFQELGHGASATVYKTLNLNTGSHIAVKIFHYIPNMSQSEERILKAEYRREVKLMSELSHPNIAVFLHAQGWEPNHMVEIFMEAYHCSLMALIVQWKASKESAKQPPFFVNLVKQMLHALIYLHDNNVMHRDIKPENILADEAHNFYLADFGLSKTEDNSHSWVGSLEFTAPDVFLGRLQTTKLDIWSMGVVILDVLGILHPCPFTWDNLLRGERAWYRTVIELTKQHVPQILPMFDMEARTRLSARECLQKIFYPDSRIRGMPMIPPILAPSSKQATAPEPRALPDPSATIFAESRRAAAALSDSATPREVRALTASRASPGRVNASCTPSASSKSGSSSSHLAFLIEDLSFGAIATRETNTRTSRQVLRDLPSSATQLPATASSSVDLQPPDERGQSQRGRDQLPETPTLQNQPQQTGSSRIASPASVMSGSRAQDESLLHASPQASSQPSRQIFKDASLRASPRAPHQPAQQPSSLSSQQSASLLSQQLLQQVSSQGSNQSSPLPSTLPLQRLSQQSSPPVPGQASQHPRPQPWQQPLRQTLQQPSSRPRRLPSSLLSQQLIEQLLPPVSRQLSQQPSQDVARQAPNRLPQQPSPEPLPRVSLRASQRASEQQDQPSRQTLARQYEPSTLGSFRLASSPDETGRCEPPGAAPLHWQQQQEQSSSELPVRRNPPPRLRSFRLANVAAGTEGHGSHPLARRQGPARQRTESDSASLADIQRIGQAYRQEYRRDAKRAIEQARQSQPLQPVRSEEDGLADVRRLGRVHREAYRREERLALQRQAQEQAQRQAPRSAQSQPIDEGDDAARRTPGGRQQVAPQRDQPVRAIQGQPVRDMQGQSVCGTPSRAARQNPTSPASSQDARVARRQAPAQSAAAAPVPTPRQTAAAQLKSFPLPSTSPTSSSQASASNSSTGPEVPRARAQAQDPSSRHPEGEPEPEPPTQQRRDTPATRQAGQRSPPVSAPAPTSTSTTSRSHRQEESGRRAGARTGPGPTIVGQAPRRRRGCAIS